MKLSSTEKTTTIVEKGNVLRIPKIYRNLPIFFSSLNISTFLKTFFKPKFQKTTKTVNLNVNCDSSKNFLDLQSSDIVDNDIAWECANKYVA